MRESEGKKDNKHFKRIMGRRRRRRSDGGAMKRSNRRTPPREREKKGMMTRGEGNNKEGANMS